MPRVRLLGARRAIDLDSPSTMVAGSLATVLAKPLQEFRELSPAPSFAEREDMLKCYISVPRSTTIVQEAEMTRSMRLIHNVHSALAIESGC